MGSRDTDIFRSVTSQGGTRNERRTYEREVRRLLREDPPSSPDFVILRHQVRQSIRGICVTRELGELDVLHPSKQTYNHYINRGHYSPLDSYPLLLI